MPVGRSFRHRETTGEFQNVLLRVLFLICKNKLLFLNPFSPIFILILELGRGKIQRIVRVEGLQKEAQTMVIQSQETKWNQI